MAKIREDVNVEHGGMCRGQRANNKKRPLFLLDEIRGRNYLLLIAEKLVV